MTPTAVSSRCSPTYLWRSPKSFFERVLDEIKESKGAKYDTDLNAEDMKEIVVRFKEIYKEKMGVEFPQDPKVQLMEAIKAVSAPGITRAPSTTAA